MDGAELRRRMGVTSGSRFNAARRLSAVDRSFNLVLSLVSVAIIALTVVPYIYEISDGSNRLIALFTIAASVALLVLTNLNTGNQNMVLSEQLHRCALEVNEVSRELDAALAGNDDSGTSRCAKNYSEILQKYSVNHEKIDYIEHKLHRRDEFMNEYSGWSGQLKVVWQSLAVWQAHNRVWIIGLSTLGLCMWILSTSIDLT